MRDRKRLESLRGLEITNAPSGVLPPSDAANPRRAVSTQQARMAPGCQLRARIIRPGGATRRVDPILAVQTRATGWTERPVNMARLQAKSLEKPDEVRPFHDGKVEIFDLGDIVVGRMIFQPGWRWAEQVKPIAGTELCEYHHIGVALAGIFHVRMSDGRELDIGPNTAFEIPPGHDAWVVGDEPFVTLDFAGMRTFGVPAEASGERVLATIMFTDVVDSTALAERIGDTAWRKRLADHNDRARFLFAQFRGREIKETGDGFLVLFDGSARAVRCAAAIRDSVSELGLQIRAGIHTGEVELVTNDVRGVAVHTAARILALAAPAEILVSSTTYELLAGSGIPFLDRGSHELKGLTGTRSLFALGDSARL
jgi:class 3 adenylate cyclase